MALLPDRRAAAPDVSGRHTAYPGEPPLQILAPTFLEYAAVRSVLPRASIVRSGIALARWRGVPDGAAVVACGLAGALGDMAPGTVVVPDQVGLIDGTVVRCDPKLTAALRTAARARGYDLETGPLLTSPTLVNGADRLRWSNQGYVAVDMETGLLAAPDIRLATVRVILDTPRHEISEEWLQLRRAVFRPGVWPELLWLACAAPAYAVRAAMVLRAALGPRVENAPRGG